MWYISGATHNIASYRTAPPESPPEFLRVERYPPMQRRRGGVPHSPAVVQRKLDPGTTLGRRSQQADPPERCRQVGCAVVGRHGVGRRLLAVVPVDTGMPQCSGRRLHSSAEAPDGTLERSRGPARRLRRYEGPKGGHELIQGHPPVLVDIPLANPRVDAGTGERNRRQRYQ